MKRLTFSCFSEKAVVNCRDGRIMGYPYDLRFDADSGNILSFFVKESGKLCFFSKPNTAEIPWERITKIGDDIILVDTDFFPRPRDTKQKKEKKYFFGG